MYGITFDPDSNLSQYRQLVDQLRDQITKGLLSGGSRLASTRELSESLHIARSIVLEAIEQLKMEGYLKTVHGSGTFVSPNLIWKSGTPQQRISLPKETALESETISFVPGMPDLSLFPRRQWLQCYHKALEYADMTDLGYSPPEGRRDLCEALCRHLYETKGIRTEAERIVLTAGSSQAFALLAGIFSAAKVVMEDPQAPFIRRVFQGLGCRLSYVPVDEEGILPEKIPGKKQDLIYVTPTHQFPLGGTLGADRRVGLLARARETGAYIIEDDFDSEFRYGRHPVTPLQVMDPERVAYVGTFSKNVSPALRMGYLVLPPGLHVRIKTFKRRWDLRNESLSQKAMALFLSEGHLERHLRRCHRAYRQKNEFLQKLVQERLKDKWRILGATTGMHLVLRHELPSGRKQFDVSGVARLLREKGMVVETVSHYCQENANFRDCLIVAYGNRTEGELESLVKLMKSIS